MSALYFDLGNTRVKWKSDSGQGAFPYDQAAAAMASLLAVENNVSTVVFASVVKGERRDRFISILREEGIAKTWECVVTPEAIGVKCAYQDYQRLGVDRWLAVVAAWDLVKGAAIVVDLGTAVTVDFIDNSGVHQGGFIVPGLKLGVSSLLAGTSNIIVDAGSLATVDVKPGRSTNEAVYGGAKAAMVGFIEVSLSRHEESFPQAKLLITGGDAALVEPHLRCHYQQLPNLVFDGMRLLQEHNLTVEVPI